MLPLGGETRPGRGRGGGEGASVDGGIPASRSSSAPPAPDGGVSGSFPEASSVDCPDSPAGLRPTSPAWRPAGAGGGGGGVGRAGRSVSHEAAGTPAQRGSPVGAAGGAVAGGGLGGTS